MSDKPRLKYEKPVSIDMGRVAPILGSCAPMGSSATDCGFGHDNSTVPVCSPSGAQATNMCMSGTGATPFCYPGGSAKGGSCYSGSGFH